MFITCNPVVVGVKRYTFSVPEVLKPHEVVIELQIPPETAKLPLVTETPQA